MSYWQENARRHAPREKEQLDAQEARDKEERAALRKRHISDQRQKESSSKKENVSAQMNSFSGQVTSNRSTRKRSHEISPADAAREEYRMGFAGMGASVASRPVNLNMDRWIYQQQQAQQQQQQQQHQHQHHYNNMVKMHQQHMMQQHMPVNNGAPVAQPHMNMMHNGLHGSGGLINAGGSPHPPASFSVRQQQIMPHQPPQNAAQSQVPMMALPAKSAVSAAASGMRLVSLRNSSSAPKVAVLGASDGIGQSIGLLLKADPLIKHLALYDVVGTPGVAANLSHIHTKAKVTIHTGPAELAAAIEGADVIVIPLFVSGITSDEKLALDLIIKVTQFAPQGLLIIVTPNHFAIERRDATEPAEVLNCNVNRMVYFVHPDLEKLNFEVSLAHSTALAGVRFANALVRGIKGEKNVQCAYVASEAIDGVKYFSTPIELGPNGVKKILGVGKVSPFEQSLRAAFVRK